MPGTIQAEDYDLGGEGVAYHDTTPGNQGGVYRYDDVDIEQTAGLATPNVGWIRDGEYLTYTANIATAGAYTMTVRVASPNTGRSGALSVDGSSAATFTVPNTGSYAAFQYGLVGRHPSGRDPHSEADLPRRRPEPRLDLVRTGHPDAAAGRADALSERHAPRHDPGRRLRSRRRGRCVPRHHRRQQRRRLSPGRRRRRGNRRRARRCRDRGRRVARLHHRRHGILRQRPRRPRPPPRERPRRGEGPGRGQRQGRRERECPEHGQRHGLPPRADAGCGREGHAPTPLPRRRDEYGPDRVPVDLGAPGVSPGPELHRRPDERRGAAHGPVHGHLVRVCVRLALGLR